MMTWASLFSIKASRQAGAHMLGNGSSSLLFTSLYIDTLCKQASIKESIILHICLLVPAHITIIIRTCAERKHRGEVHEGIGGACQLPQGSRRDERMVTIWTWVFGSSNGSGGVLLLCMRKHVLVWMWFFLRMCNASKRCCFQRFRILYGGMEIENLAWCISHGKRF